MQRTEEQMVAMAPVRAWLGDKEYDIKLLGVTKQQAWRSKLFQEMQPVVRAFVQKADDESALNQGLAYGLLRSPEIMTEMLFEYAPNLPKAEILEQASEEQLAVAFIRIMEVCFPFQKPLGTLVQVMRASSQQ